MLLNINSLENKITSVSSLLKDKNIDILVIQDTKINPILVESYLYGLDGYNLIRRDRVVNQGGRILIYIKSAHEKSTTYAVELNCLLTSVSLISFVTIALHIKTIAFFF